MLAEIEKPSVRRHWLKAIRGLMQAAIPAMRKDDPTSGIPGIKLPKSRGHHAWTDAEIEQYRAYWPLGTQQRLVFEFVLETVSRRGEVIRLGPQHVKNGRIRIERTHGSADVDIPISPELQAACNSMPKAHLTYIVTAYGKPRSKYGLGNDFAEMGYRGRLARALSNARPQEGRNASPRRAWQHHSRTDGDLRSPYAKRGATLHR